MTIRMLHPITDKPVVGCASLLPVVMPFDKVPESNTSLLAAATHKYIAQMGSSGTSKTHMGRPR